MPFHGLEDVWNGKKIKFKKSVFQGHAAIVNHPNQVNDIIARMASVYYFSESTQMPYAYRLSAPEGCSDWNDGEYSMDGKEVGAGDKLLVLLQRWGVYNIVVFVTRHDRSLSGSLLTGVTRRYTVLLECAKEVLEKVYLAKLSPQEAAEFELSRTRPRPVVAQLKMSSCLLSPETVNFPKNHIPTSDGSGRAVTKRGCINNFKAIEEMPPSSHVPENDDVVLPAIVSNEHRDFIYFLEKLDLSKADFELMKSLRRPPQYIHLVLVCFAYLLNVDDLSWESCREMITSRGFATQLLQLNPIKLRKVQVNNIRIILQTPDLTPHTLQGKSPAAANLLQYVHHLISQYDRLHLGISIQTDDRKVKNFPTLALLGPTPTPPPEAKPAKRRAKFKPYPIQPLPPSPNQRMKTTGIVLDNSIDNRIREEDESERIVARHGIIVDKGRMLKKNR